MPQQRQNWGNKHRVLPELDLVKLQLDSYQDFIENGIRESLDAVNGDTGIEDYTGKTGL